MPVFSFPFHYIPCYWSHLSISCHSYPPFFLPTYKYHIIIRHLTYTHTHTHTHALSLSLSIRKKVHLSLLSCKFICHHKSFFFPSAISFPLQTLSNSKISLLRTILSEGVFHAPLNHRHHFPAQFTLHPLEHSNSSSSPTLPLFASLFLLLQVCQIKIFVET